MIKIAFVGRFAIPKNNRSIIKISEKLTEAGFIYKIDCYGDAEPTDNEGLKIKREFLEELKKSALPVNTLGFKKEISSILKNYDFLLLPSFWEGWPLVTIEASSVGCIPICSDILTGPREFVAEITDYKKKIDYPYIGQGGILLPTPTDEPSFTLWARTIISISDDIELMKIKKLACIKHAKKFSFEEYKSSWIKKVKSLT